MWFEKRRIYLDHASATPVLPEARASMRDAEDLFANPGAIHAEGVTAKQALEKSREGVARALGCKARELLFTSGLTESNNLAVLGLARQLEIEKRLEGSHWVTSSIEHPAVLESFAEIERRGGVVTHVDPDTQGIISPEKVLNALRKETVLVSIGWANSEIGTVQPIRDISRAIHASHSTILMHTDAGQAPVYLSPQVHTLGVDLFSLGANKMHGPHGIGALYLSNRVHLAPITFGGRQERGLRAGTESVALAAGFAEAMQIIGAEREQEYLRIKKIRDEFAAQILAISGVVVNGALKHALPHMLNISIPAISSEYVVLALDRAGISISTKSACREGEERESHVVSMLGGDTWRAKTTLRFSLGRETTRADCAFVVRTLADILARNES